MHVYEVLRRPLTTEKSNYLRDTYRKYAFEVDPRANKQQMLAWPNDSPSPAG